jgi:hypothetical protein
MLDTIKLYWLAFNTSLQAKFEYRVDCQFAPQIGGAVEHWTSGSVETVNAKPRSTVQLVKCSYGEN